MDATRTGGFGRLFGWVVPAALFLMTAALAPAETEGNMDYSKIPAVDEEAPEETETALFALG
jgi:hypothetical protein